MVVYVCHKHMLYADSLAPEMGEFGSLNHPSVLIFPMYAAVGDCELPGNNSYSRAFLG